MDNSIWNLNSAIFILMIICASQNIVKNSKKQRSVLQKYRVEKNPGKTHERAKWTPLKSSIQTKN